MYQRVIIRHACPQYLLTTNTILYAHFACWIAQALQFDAIGSSCD